MSSKKFVDVDNDEHDHIRYVLIFLLLYFSIGFFVYSSSPVHVYI
jgi:hypothetical protein